LESVQKKELKKPKSHNEIHIFALSMHFVAKDCQHGYLYFSTTALQFAVTTDEDSASDSPSKTRLCGKLCEISDDKERPGLWTAEKSSSGRNPRDMKSCPPLG